MSVSYTKDTDQPLSGPIEVVRHTGFQDLGVWRLAMEARGWLVRKTGDLEVTFRDRNRTPRPGVKFLLRRGDEQIRALAWYETEEEEEEA